MSRKPSSRPSCRSSATRLATSSSCAGSSVTVKTMGSGGTFGLLGDPVLRPGGGVGVEFDPDRATADLVGGDEGGAGAAEGVDHQCAGSGEVVDVVGGFVD